VPLNTMLIYVMAEGRKAGRAPTEAEMAD